MKYLFINAVAGSGSTGRIAADKCRELQKAGHRCVLAYGRQQANCDDIETKRIGNPLDNRLHGIRTRVLDEHGFGSKAATGKFLTWVKEYNPDIIWLHNLHGYYINIEMLFDYLKKTDKKVYWTLHDCWSFTGHCSHFTYVQCDKWKTGCCTCVQKNRYPKSILLDNSRKNYERKKKAFCGVKDMTLITPSKWLAELVKESFLKEYPVEVVYNTIDTDVFKPTPSDFRKRCGLEDKKIILGVANVWEERKGLKDFIELADMLDDSYAIVLVGLTAKQIKQMPKKIKGVIRTNSGKKLAEIYTAAEMTVKETRDYVIPVGVKNIYEKITEHRCDSESKERCMLICIPRTNNVKELAAIYTTADFFINPTYEDNYPTVNLEARACGTSVITYDVGGCRETIEVREVE